ncbi:transposase [Palleronia caenipelagi]
MCATGSNTASNAVDRLHEPGATQGSVARELGITGTQLKTWRLEIEAFGSMEAKHRQKADAAELERLRKENKRLAEENEILQMGEQANATGPSAPANAFFASRAVKPR